MSEPLRVLLVEDSEDDALLLLRALRHGFGQVAHERVDTTNGLMAALQRHTWDLVLCDQSLPRFSGMEALACIRSQSDVPVILVSGAFGEEWAVDAMRAGAQDYLTKGNLSRLVPAVERELRETALRRERQDMSEQLRLSARLASIGTMAAGVAHEINTPLMALGGSLELLAQSRELTGASPDVATLLEHAMEACRHIRRIVGDVRVFSRAEVDSRAPIDVRPVIESAVRMSWPDVRPRAQLETRFETVPMVLANEARLRQVVLNLLVNAAQAMPDDRPAANTITVRTFLVNEATVAIEVQDTGVGMTPEVQARIYDAFYTTKPIGQGSGLGLAICRRIVSDLGGDLIVRSQVGHGSAFRVTLPAVETMPPVAGHTVPDEGRRRLQILIVDDDRTVGIVMQRILAPDHDVTALVDASDALVLLTSGEAFDVILCDLMMGAMSGMDLHRAVARVVPDQASRFVFLTGGAFSAGARTFLDQVPNRRAEKPLSATALKVLVQEAAAVPVP